MQLIPILFWLVLSYCIAAPFSDSISMDLSQTLWGSGWTYAAWALSYFAAGFVVFIKVLAIWLVIAAAFGASFSVRARRPWR